MTIRKENTVTYLTTRKRAAIVGAVVGCTLFSVTARGLDPAYARQSQEGAETPQFGSEYEELTPQQKALVDDLCLRFKEVTGRELNPV